MKNEEAHAQARRWNEESGMKMIEKADKMTSERAVEQLRTLIEDAESHRDADGSLDQVFQDDIAALKFAIEAIEAFDEMDESLTAMLKECAGS